ncbi:MAG TPA: hypothetical protein VKG79_09135 [Bryobacteraceae bacterium]|nr:hypothetical protein [Bryobacteraceae bacterium]
MGQLYDVGLRSADQVRSDFQILDAKGIRLPDEAVKALLERIR